MKKRKERKKRIEGADELIRLPLWFSRANSLSQHARLTLHRPHHLTMLSHAISTKISLTLRFSQLHTNPNYNRDSKMKNPKRKLTFGDSAAQVTIESPSLVSSNTDLALILELGFL